MLVSLGDLEAHAGEAVFPLHALQMNGMTIGLVRDAAFATLPFSSKTCTDSVVNSFEEAPRFLAHSETTQSVAFQWCARVAFSISSSAVRHALLLRNLSSNASCFYLLSNSGSERDLGAVMASVEAREDLWDSAPSKGAGCSHLHIFFMSEVEVPDTMSTNLSDLPVVSTPGTAGDVTTRVVLGNSPGDICACLRELVSALLHGDDRRFRGTEVCWPAELLFPVNVHTRDDAVRRLEHAALLLPNKALLHHQDALPSWSTWADLRQRWRQQKQQLQQASTNAPSFRTGESWERHLVTDPHKALPAFAAPSLTGAETLLTSGSYDYYHYRVDGFRDDGWGCAYRSLQTLLSWFQHAGYVTAPIPSIRRIQEILYATDPDKTKKKQFVGSSDWIGSFEVMLVLQHYMPGLDCTIKRLESGGDLESDAAVQLLLSEHFRNPHAAPVMIGGSSYAHTILGIHVNVNTMESRYLILDPHYSANPTQLKTAIKKGFVGWKEASKFFETGSWYNLCVPRTDLYDPR
ncbi:hypothetical protein ABB37_03572 [Leptomonas pyrrhocoris]|uniref:UFSP1/2/DUB catalytic domain-containing protein n=1 Tax=Leptomonas pyrrhocoris TaxID=157538 RepID=A0A0N0DX34_LEPPY|nr:hypothetical protein ABB37_03572 [Leptomonas pyrrhocoris]KPA82525.1 hypothetical protein ABB37_03572 [Leptomonas pyrrhocoris]|eukprot:XP_015660964.1 hypothetical protein ABB37_03572 [Leptomonas pyrrhocoris]